MIIPGDCKMHQNDLDVGILLILLHHKVILFYDSEFLFLGGGGGRDDLGLFWASCSENQNMGSYEVKWT